MAAVEEQGAATQEIARNVGEAEGELEKLVRSGYRAVVAFDSMGEAERSRYGLERLDAAGVACEATADDEGDDETVAGPIAIAVDMNESGDAKPAGGDNPDS